MNKFPAVPRLADEPIAKPRQIADTTCLFSSPPIKLMPSQPPQSPQRNSTLVLGFVNPATQEFVAMADIGVVPAPGGLIKIVALDDIPKGSVAYLPLNQQLLNLSDVPQTQQLTPNYSTFDHKSS